MVKCQDSCRVCVQCCSDARLEVACCDGAHACQEGTQVHVVWGTLDLAQQCTLLQELHGQRCMPYREEGSRSTLIRTRQVAGVAAPRGLSSAKWCA
jgi:hypothetical protein